MKLTKCLLILAAATSITATADPLFAKPTVPLFKNTYDIVNPNCVLNLRLQNNTNFTLNIINILQLPQTSTLTPAAFPLKLQPGFNSNLLVSLPAITSTNGLQLTLNYTLTNGLAANPTTATYHPIALKVTQTNNNCNVNSIIPVLTGLGVNAPANVVLFNNTLAFK